MSQIQSFDQIEADNIYRYKTGFPGLDKIYGSSFINGINCEGLPVGQISLWAGAGGVGKTRMAIEMALRINATGSRVLFYQNEVTPSAFKSWVKKPVVYPENFFVINYSSLEEQIGGISSVNPDVVIVDSINMLDGFANPTKLRQILLDYKKVITDNNCHAIFISHLNKEGQVKGNNDIEYLVDTVASLTKYTDCVDQNGQPDESVFKLDIGKNRYGISGGWVAFKHVDEGVIYLVGSLDGSSETRKKSTTVKQEHRTDGPILGVKGANFSCMFSPSAPDYIETLWATYKESNQEGKDYLKPFIDRHHKENNLPLPDYSKVSEKSDNSIFGCFSSIFKPKKVEPTNVANSIQSDNMPFIPKTLKPGHEHDIPDSLWYWYKKYHETGDQDQKEITKTIISNFYRYRQYTMPDYDAIDKTLKVGALARFKKWFYNLS